MTDRPTGPATLSVALELMNGIVKHVESWNRGPDPFLDDLHRVRAILAAPSEAVYQPRLRPVLALIRQYHGEHGLPSERAARLAPHVGSWTRCPHKWCREARETVQALAASPEPAADGLDVERLAAEIHRLYCPVRQRIHPDKRHIEDDVIAAKVILRATLHEPSRESGEER